MGDNTGGGLHGASSRSVEIVVKPEMPALSGVPSRARSDICVHSTIIVKRKAQACKTYFKKLFEGIDLDYRYEFITEKHLFKTPTEYSLFIQQHSK